MAIPAAELPLITGIQTDLANAKASMIAARNKAESLRGIANAAGDVPGAVSAFNVKNAMGVAWMAVEAAHADASRQLLNQYGAANAGPVVMGGGAR